jgi:2'-5' RNA ligase
MRAFIAVELPEEIRQEAAALQSDLRGAGADVKWVEPANLHLTLKFLGEIEEAQVTPLTEALRSITHHHSPFTVSLEGIGAFPSTTRPRGIWVGISQGQEALEKLAGQVEEACSPFVLRQACPERSSSFDSAQDERSRRAQHERHPFSAHLTIGRVRGPDRLAGLIKKLQVVKFQGSAPAPVNRLTLFQSLLSPHGPTYTPLAEIPLAK